MICRGEFTLWLLTLKLPLKNVIKQLGHVSAVCVVWEIKNLGSLESTEKMRVEALGRATLVHLLGSKPMLQILLNAVVKGQYPIK